MALTVGTINKDLSAIHLGSKAVHSVYRGPVKIWPVTLGRMTMTIHTGKFAAAEGRIETSYGGVVEGD